MDGLRQDNSDLSLILSQFIPYRIVVLGKKISERLAPLYEDEGVSIPEWRVLAVIAQYDDIAARDVVEQTPMDKMAVSRAVSSLEHREIVGRRVSTIDARVSRLFLTKDGRRLFDRIADIALKFERELLVGLSLEDREKFEELISYLDVASSK